MARYCFIGAPGVGKGTFAKIISSRCDFIHISLGDVLRREIKAKSAIGKTISEYVMGGQLVPDTLACDIIKSEIDGHDKVIIDGFPRTLPQARFLEQSVGKIHAINILLNDDVAVQKMLGRRHCIGCNRSFNVADVMNDGFMMPAILPDRSTCPLGPRDCDSHQQLEIRSDDTEDTIRARFSVYHSNSAPILDFYRKRSCLTDFQVRRGVDDVDDLIAVMNQCITDKS